MHVTICIITCNRPEGLERLLASISELEFSEVTPEVEVLVVDNDPDERARALCARSADALPGSLRYETEARRGIPFARNTAVARAAETTDFIVFVDDDETVDPRWLAELLAVQAQTGADVVTGPAVPRFPAEAPTWLVRSGAFDLLRYETGAERPFAYTHNVLTRREVFGAVQPNFDERMAHCGGSDTHFFRRVRRAGFRIVWADAAIAYEWVPAARLTTGWILRRSLRIGGTDAYIERDLDGLGAALRRLPWRAARYVARGALRLLSLPARGRAAFLFAGEDWARAFGLLAGMVGFRHQEYRVRT
ncbi:MAG: glycosyltransferase [Planctomycetes bacterium]|nr:glycosyltransferase [Planctomycetota bacterium]